MKFLCWVPIVGVIFEGMYLSKYGKNYLADPMHPVRFFFGALWHASMACLIPYLFSGDI
jgi:hypothetical protein